MEHAPCQKRSALPVGIYDYAPDVGKLAGCLNDVDHFHSYLNDSVDKSDLAIEALKDHDATRDNIIKTFRTHPGKARGDDVALFHYSLPKCLQRSDRVPSSKRCSA